MKPIFKAIEKVIMPMEDDVLIVETHTYYCNRFEELAHLAVLLDKSLACTELKFYENNEDISKYFDILDKVKI